MDADLYDEFGNYIGPDLPSSDEEDDLLDDTRDDDDAAIDLEQEYEQRQRLVAANDDNADNIQIDDDDPGQIVLHEDKKYYQTHEEIYGRDVEAIVQEEDTQPLTEPIIKPQKDRKWQLQEEDCGQSEEEIAYMLALVEQPDLLRNVAIVGHLHSGKTSFADCLVEDKHEAVAKMPDREV